MSEETNKSIQKYIKEMRPFLLMCAIAPFFHLLYPHHWMGAGLVEFVAHALFVAGVLGITVDRYAKKRLIDEVAKDVAHYLIGYRLPRQIQGDIKRRMETSIVRYDWEQRYKLERSEAGQVLIKVEMSYKVENYSPVVVPFLPKLDADDVQQPQFYSCEWVQSAGESRQFDGDELSKFIKVDRPGVQRVELMPVPIKPRKDDGSEFCRFYWSYSVTVPQDSYDVVTFWTPVIDPAIAVECPDDFEFVVSSDLPIKAQTKRRWVFEGLRAEGQHIQVKWRSRNAPATQTKSPHV